jgi:hypothetical protein
MEQRVKVARQAEATSNDVIMPVRAVECRKGLLNFVCMIIKRRNKINFLCSTYRFPTTVVC